MSEVGFSREYISMICNEAGHDFEASLEDSLPFGLPAIDSPDELHELFTDLDEFETMALCFHMAGQRFKPSVVVNNVQTFVSKYTEEDPERVKLAHQAYVRQHIALAGIYVHIFETRDRIPIIAFIPDKQEELRQDFGTTVGWGVYDVIANDRVPPNFCNGQQTGITFQDKLERLDFITVTADKTVNELGTSIIHSNWPL